MIIIISLYEDNSVNYCKPLELINGKKLIEITLNNLIFSNEANFIFLVTEEYKTNYSLDLILKDLLPNNLVKIVGIDETTYGLPETILKSESFVKNNENILIYTPYIYLNEKININNLKGNFIFYFKSNSENHSYAVINDNKIEKIKEKIVISNNALIGIYGFENKEILFKYIKEQIKNKMMHNNKYYISLIYNLMLRDKIKINHFKIENMYPIGSINDRNIVEKLYFNSISEKSIIGLASDHSGFKAKKCMIKLLNKHKIKYVDYGSYTDKNCDYYSFIKNLTNDIKNKKINYGFGFCRTGQGVNICANKQENIISGLIHDNFTCQMSVEHNGCNFFCFAEKNHSYKKFDKYLKILFKSKFLGGRFLTRYKKNLDIK